MTKKFRTLFYALCVLCSLSVSAPTRADFAPASTTIVPRDVYSDSHYQIGPLLNDFAKDPRIAAVLATLGWDGAPIDEDDYLHLATHRSGQARSDLAQIVAVLYNFKLIGQAQEAPPEAADYPGKPNYDTVLGRLEDYGLVLRTSGRAEQKFYAERYYQNKLTVADDGAWMAAQRGLYWLPESVEIDPSCRGAYVDLERKIALWGLSGQEVDRGRAYVAYFQFENCAVPGPGAQASEPFVGALVVNPRRVFYGGRKIENAIVQGRASDAAKNGTRVAWLLGLQSLYEMYAMQTYPLSERAWQYALGLPFTESEGGGFHVGNN